MAKKQTEAGGKQDPPNFLFIEERFRFGVNVERLRRHQQLPITTLSKMANISRPTLYKIERGEADLKLSVMTRVAHALGVDLVDLFADPNDPRNRGY